MISVLNAAGGYTRHPVVRDMTFSVHKQEFFGIIGPNGSGKTTLAKLLSALIPLQTGDIQLSGRQVSDYAPKELARMMAVLPQHTSQTFSYTVYETVSLGRYAHQRGLFGSFSREDEQIVQDVMVQTGIQTYQGAKLDALSGGERQRVYLAQALAQDPQILLLDEPTNHLDLAYQKDLLDLLKRWTREKNLTVISIFHDLNLAGLYCDRLLLLENGRNKICGTPEEVLKKERLDKVYGTTIEQNPHPKVPKPQIMLIPDAERSVQVPYMVNARLLKITEYSIVLQSEKPLKTMSSSVFGAGIGWYRNFVNQREGSTYGNSGIEQSMIDDGAINGLDPNETVVTMIPVDLSDAAYNVFENDGLSIFVVVTAASRSATDVTQDGIQLAPHPQETINTWIFINGYIQEETYIQAIVTATEAKTKAIQDMNIVDSVTGSPVTGTPTDSILVAATQEGRLLTFADPVTQLGQLVARGVYTCTYRALQNTQNRCNQFQSTPPKGT